MTTMVIDSKDTTAKELISLYKDFWQKDALVEITVGDMLQGILSGQDWEKATKWVRSAPDQDTPKEKGVEREYDRRKKKVNAFTVSGTFTTKTENGQKSSSGLQAHDLDHLNEDVEVVKRKLAADPFVYAVFKSIGGKGLCVLFKIESERWKEAFDGIRDYLTETYGLAESFDPSSSNINRIRFISHDTDLHYNPKAQIFKRYPRKAEQKRRQVTGSYIHTDRDLKHIFQQIHDRSLDMTGSYYDWFRIGWALIAHFGDAAEELFHEVSQYHPNYTQEETSRKFKYLMVTRPHTITIATFYWYCKQFGLDIMTPKTKEIVSLAAMNKRQKVTERSALDTVLKMTDATREEAEAVVRQVYEAKEEIATEETLFDQLELFLKTNYPMRRNGITRYIEDPDGGIYEEKHFNSIYVAAVKSLGEKVKYQDIDRLIRSEFTPTYNPFAEFIERYRYRKPEGLIRRLADTIHTDTGFGSGEFFPDYAYTFIRKWLIGIISSMHGEHSPLVLVLTGGQNAGKTEWFRRMLPDDLKSYFGQTTFEKGQDDEILMCKKLILFNDEFGGMNKHDIKKFKNLTSTQTFSLREPYGRAHVDLNRIAVLCGSSNEDDVLNDPTGNRRVVPVRVLSLNFDAYNSIDKIDLLMEAYHAWAAGERHHLTKEDIKQLNENTQTFEDICIERELIQKYYTVPEDRYEIGHYFLSATEIKVFLEKTSQQRIGIKRLAQELVKLGFACEIRKVKGQMKRGYAMKTDVEIAPF